MIRFLKEHSKRRLQNRVTIYNIFHDNHSKLPCFHMHRPMKESININPTNMWMDADLWRKCYSLSFAQQSLILFSTLCITFSVYDFLLRQINNNEGYPYCKEKTFIYLFLSLCIFIFIVCCFSW